MLQSASSEPSLTLPEHPQRSTGLAIGWRLVLYIVLVLGIIAALEWPLGLALRHRGPGFNTAALLLGEAAGFLGALAAAGIMARIEGHKLGVYGLPLRQGFGKLFWQGAALGLFEIGAIIGVIAAFGGYHFGELALHDAALWGWGGFYAVFFLAVGLAEEFNLRGYLQFTLAEGIGFWPAAVVLSLLFGGLHLHNPGENWIGILDVVLTGLLFCFTLRRTGSLWFAVGMHASFDFGETFLFSVRDSGVNFPHQLSHAYMSGPAWLTGGTVGPEGTFFDPVLLLLFFYIIHRWFPAKSTAAEQAAEPPAPLSA